MAPGVVLLHPLRRGDLRGNRREHRLGPFPAGDVERLERLVREVEGVSEIEVAVIGRGGEEHVRELVRRRAGTHGGDDRALGALGVAHLDEPAEPAAEPFGLDLPRRERSEPEAGCVSRALVGHVGEALEERSRDVLSRHVRREIREAGKRRQSTSPAAGTPLDAEVETRAKRAETGLVRIGEGDRGLREHERKIELEPVAETPALMCDAVASRAHVDVDLVVAKFDRERP